MTHREEEALSVPCCACVGRVTFALPTKDERISFFHTKPLCYRFDATNTADAVADYLRDCRLALNN